MSHYGLAQSTRFLLSCVCFTGQSDLRKNQGLPEVAILGADQTDRGLWGQEC